MTRAPRRLANSAVRSVESLSTTMTSSTNEGTRERTSTMPFSSLRHGMTTVILRSLYTRLDGSINGQEPGIQESKNPRIQEFKNGCNWKKCESRFINTVTD